MKSMIEPQRAQRTQRDSLKVFFAPFAFFAVKNFWVWVLPVLFLAAWLGARGLNADAIWNDEFYSIHDAGGPPYGPISPTEIWTRVATRNPWHAPGFFILLSGWGRLVGWSPPALRALPLLVGLLGIAWTYRLGRDWLSPRAGLYAAAVLATSAFFVHYLHELRMYTFFVLFGAFALWVYMRMMESGRKPSLLLWLGLLAGALGMLYTHYFSALTLVGIGAYHVARLLPLTPKRHPQPLPASGEGRMPARQWWGVVGVLALAGALYLPWVSVLLAGLKLAADSEGLHARALDMGETLGALVYWFGNGSVGLFIVVVGLAALRSLTSRRLTPPPNSLSACGEGGLRRIWFFALAILAALLLTNGALKLMHAGRVRYLLVLWAPLALLAGAGLAYLEGGGARQGRTRKSASLQRVGRVAAWGLLGAWMALGVGQSLDGRFAADVDGTSYAFPMHIIAAELRPLVAPQDAVVSYPPDGFPYWVYERNQEIGAFYFNPVPVRLVTARTMRDPADQPAKRAEVEAAIGDAPRVWLATIPAFTPSTLPGLEAFLDAHYQQCRTQVDDPNLSITLYTRLPLCCAPDGEARIDYGNGVRLMDVSALPERVGDSLEVTTSWSVDESVPRETYSVALHVLDDGGALVTQTDFGLPHVAFGCQTAVLDTSPLAAGAYQLALIVYRWQDGARLTADGNERAIVGTFEIQ